MALVEDVKQREHQGYAYEGANGSFALLAQRALSQVPNFFTLDRFKIAVERRFNALGERVTFTEAIVTAHVGQDRHIAVGEGNGPVSALDDALRKVLIKPYPELAALRLTDFKVRILTPEEGTDAVTRVLIEWAVKGGTGFTTLGVSPNLIDASYEAMADAIAIFLLRSRRQARAEEAGSADAAPTVQAQV